MCKTSGKVSRKLRDVENAVRDVVRLLDGKCARFRGYDDFEKSELAVMGYDDMCGVEYYVRLCRLLVGVRAKLDNVVVG